MFLLDGPMVPNSCSMLCSVADDEQAGDEDGSKEEGNADDKAEKSSSHDTAAPAQSST